jgi:DNA-binding HxlR family transcriptional regulator
MNFGEKSFNELKRMTDINAVTLSKKLSYLKAEGLVDSSVLGNENHYFITKKSEEFRPLIKDIEGLVLNK